MVTINSLSGGKTSCFMSLHFPAEYDVFALVEMQAAMYKPKHGSLTQEEKCAFGWIRKFRPSFWSTAEDNRTLVVLHRLHFELENRPTWTGIGGPHDGLTVIAAGNFRTSRGFDDFDTLIAQRRFLPNSQRRLCTQYLKVEPMYHYARKGLDQIEPVSMAIGFRPDEVGRTVNLYYKMMPIKKRVPNPDYDLTEAFKRFDLPGYLRRWWEVLEVEKRVREGMYVEKPVNFNHMQLSAKNVVTWRYPTFPLIEHGITHGEIVKYWRSRPEYNFPPVSNCVGCFHHRVDELQSQWQVIDNWGKMEWMAQQEERTGHLFGKKLSYRQIQKLPIQMAIDFNSAWTSCDSGGCTD